MFQNKWTHYATGREADTPVILICKDHLYLLELSHRKLLPLFLLCFCFWALPGPSFVSITCHSSGFNSFSLITRNEISQVRVGGYILSPLQIQEHKGPIKEQSMPLHHRGEAPFYQLIEGCRPLSHIFFLHNSFWDLELSEVCNLVCMWAGLLALLNFSDQVRKNIFIKKNFEHTIESLLEEGGGLD